MGMEAAVKECLTRSSDAIDIDSSDGPVTMTESAEGEIQFGGLTAGRQGTVADDLL